jgi:hypothetical protein
MAITKMWINENREFLEEAVLVLAPYMSVTSALGLLYRYRGVAPLRVLDPPVVSEETDRSGWVYLREPVRLPTPPPSAAPVRPKATQGMAWNKVVTMNTDVVEKEEEAEVEEAEVEEVTDEMMAALELKDYFARIEAFDAETHNNKLLLEVVWKVREIAMRHTCCYGVQSVSFQFELGDLVGA